MLGSDASWENDNEPPTHVSRISNYS